MELYSTLESHLNNLDRCEFKESKIFNSQADKERYESYIMFAFRKFKSLNYHIDNTNKLLKKEADSLTERSINLPRIEKTKSAKFTMKVKKDSYELFYELSAYLGALKSCLDLLSESTSFYLKGVQVNYSISPLLKQSNKKKSNILTFIKKHEKWIITIRDYRHPIVHRLVLNSKCGYEIHQLNGQTSKVLYPVLIPENTPKFALDTRKQRVTDDVGDSLNNSIHSEQNCTVTKNGIEELVDFKISIEPSCGYVRIEDFMKNHKNNCEKYFIELIETLNGLDFHYDILT
jgi:hypothetical protein